MAKSIIITDVGTQVEYRLSGSTLEMIDNGGCRDALAANGCEVSVEMDDDAIEVAVRAAWVEGYEGDPDECGLSIRIQDDEDGDLVCGSQVLVDRSGVGHYWQTVAAGDLPSNIRAEIEGEMIDGGAESHDGYRASNGLCYRW